MVLFLRESVKVFSRQILSRKMKMDRLNGKTILIEFDCKLLTKVVRWIKKNGIEQILEKICHKGLIFYRLEDFVEQFVYDAVADGISPNSYLYQKIFAPSGEWVAMEILFAFPEGLSAVDIKDLGIPTADLDLLIVEKLFRFFPRLRDIDKKIFINVFPSSLTDAVFKSNFVGLLKNTANVVVEVLEYKIFDRSEFLKTLKGFRERSVGIALDEWGSESAGISRVVMTKPDFLKIDKSITWNKTARKLVKPFVRVLRRELGINVVVEGVDSPHHVAWAKGVGAHMQGYLLHRPEALNSLME
jgi:EAL domain-containing protein (putative c-di-GMP-specific phosphodiesterase class I)